MNDIKYKEFLNEESEIEINNVSNFPLDEDRSIKRAILTLTVDGYIDLLNGTYRCIDWLAIRVTDVLVNELL